MRKRAGSDRTPAPPPPDPMPAVGARRSTRVFVPKVPQPQPQPAAEPAKRVLLSSDHSLRRWEPKATKPQPDADPARARRSAKRVPLSPDHSAHWLRRWEPNSDHDQHDKNPKPPPQPRQAPPTRSFEVLYSRKRRQRLPAIPVQDDDARFGIVFTRKAKRSKVAVTTCSSSREFVSRIGFLDAHFLTSADDDVAGILVLVDTSCSGSSNRLLRLLLPVLRWMRQSQRSKVWNLASILSSAAIATIFPSHGLHFVKLQRKRESAWLQRTLMSCGWCELRDAKKFQPVLSVNFSALPSYFQSLHSVIALHSVYLPTVIRRGMGLVGGAEEMYPRDPSDADSWAMSTGDTHLVVGLCNDEPHTVVQDFVPLEQAAGVVIHGLRLKKHQSKRSSMRHPLNWHRLRARFLDKAIGMKQGSVASQAGLKPVLTGQEVSVEPVQPKPALEISLDLLENMDDSDVSTPMGSNGKHKKFSFKSPMEHTSERLALSEVRQNIDSFHCKANLLIIQADRCFREEGAIVMLELSNSGGWCVAVKIHGVTRISLKPSEQRFYVVNRFTHAYVWAVEDGWKLEFPDKWNWLLFKELHVEGRERNSQGKVIPIPGVHEVSGGIEGIVTNPFSRPVPDYIRVADDEVGRALSRDSVYDLDLEDEQWINQMNHTDYDRSSHLKHISYEEFEKIITLFEKDAYSNPEGNNDMDQLLSRYPVLRKDYNLPAVYEYWISKRNKKGAPLIRIFQGAPVRQGRTSQKSSIKKKRSFKRQRSQTGRGKPGFFLQDNAEDAALLRVAEAERLAKQAVERAVCLRSRAQFFMENANLATYKSVMALKIAEAASISDSCRDIVSRTMD